MVLIVLVMCVCVGGKFVFDKVAAGEYTVSVSMKGACFKESSKTVQVL